jgi:hypothetical protein
MTYKGGQQQLVMTAASAFSLNQWQYLHWQNQFNRNGSLLANYVMKIITLSYGA